MNKSETLKVMAYLQVAYPHAFSKLTKDDIKVLANMWEVQFKEFDYQVVMMAVNSYISSDTTGYYPVVGKIKEIIYKLSNPNEMSEQEAWNIVKKAISKSSWYSKEEFEKLPSNLQKIVGSARQLHDWAMMDSHELDTVVASNFMRSYKMKATQEKEMKMLPSDVRNMIEQVAELKMIGD